MLAGVFSTLAQSDLLASLQSANTTDVTAVKTPL